MRTPLAGFVLAGCFASMAAAQNQKPTGDGPERVLTLTHAQNPQSLQEIVNVIRTLAGIPQVVPDAQHGTLTLQATADQFALAEWLANQLDQPAAGHAPQEYRLPGGTEVARVFYTNAASPQALQEMVNVLRSIASVFRMLPCGPQRAIALRGTVDQTALAEWLVNQLDQPTDPSAHHEYRIPGNNEVTRVIFLTHAQRPQDLQSAITAVRARTRINRLMPFDPARAMVLRATDNQVLEAEQIVQELDSGAAR